MTAEITAYPNEMSRQRVRTEPRITWKDNGSDSPLPLVDDDPYSDTASKAESDQSTVTLDSVYCNSIEENGRTYHSYKQGRYFLPNDIFEQDRLDLQHQLFRITVGGNLNICPLPEKPKRVLDIGTGTGIWAIDFANQYPDTEVIGSDLSPIQPDHVPKNCHFEIDDAEDDWVYSEPFTFIHGRALMSCFDDPSRVIKQAFANLEPGGYIEFQDAIFPMQWIGEPPRESALYRWNHLLAEGARRLGRSWTNVVNYPQYFREAGFEDVVERRFYWPISPWAKGKYLKTLAMYFQEDLASGIEAISMKVLQATGMTTEEILAFAEEVQRDLRNTDLHAYITVMFLYGRKPLNA